MIYRFQSFFFSKNNHIAVARWWHTKVIIDSKVSLVAYERLVSAETDEQRALFMKEHIASLRSHVKLLSEKNYQNAHNINAPDFVLMFVPIESSFSVAVQSDNELFADAWD